MFHHHSPLMKTVGSLSWLLGSLGALAWGLIGLGHSMGKNWNIWESDFIMNNAQWLIQPAQYIIGVAGLLGLISWFMCLGHCHSCDEKHDHKR
jgi:uncharacterized membrane protein YuzA (DUF378 family)